MNHILYICFFLFISVKTYGMYDGHNLCITNDTTICDMPDLQPQCMGIEDHNKYIMQKLVVFARKTYPNISGDHIVVKYIIEKNGHISNIKLVKCMNYKLGKYVVRCLKKLKRWFPGRKNNKPVRCLLVFNGYLDFDR